MNFKNCHVVYFKNPELLPNLKGKIIVSDFPEFNRICNLYGLIHVLNLNTQKIPEGVDCVVCNTRNQELESRITRNNLGIPIVYINMHQKWCGVCGKLGAYENENTSIGKYCSESCMKKVAGFTNEGVPEAIKDLISHKQALIKFDKSLSSRSQSNKEEEAKRKSREKFQQSMVKEAQRVEFAYRKESYKNEMRQPSHRKTKIVKKKESNPTEIKLCKSMIKGGTKQCGNRALEGSDYCGISSHSQQSQLQSQ